MTYKNKDKIRKKLKYDYKGWALKKASDEIKNDKLFIIEILAKNPLALEFVSKELQNDKKVVLEAIKAHPDAFQFASEELKNDKEFVLEAIEISDRIIKYASFNLRNDKDVAFKIIKRGAYSIKDMSHSILADKDIILPAVKVGPLVYYSVSNELKNDREVTLAAIRRNGYLMEAITSQEFKNDKEIVLAAMIEVGDTGSSYVLHYASPELRNNPVFKFRNYSTLKELSVLIDNVENFERLPLRFFESGNSDILEFAIDLVRDKLKCLPESDENKNYVKEIAKLMKNTIERNHKQLEIDAQPKNDKERYDKLIDDSFDELKSL